MNYLIAVMLGGLIGGVLVAIGFELGYSAAERVCLRQVAKHGRSNA